MRWRYRRFDQRPWSGASVWNHEFTHLLQNSVGAFMLQGDPALFYVEPMANAADEILLSEVFKISVLRDYTLGIPNYGVATAVLAYNSYNVRGDSHIDVPIWHDLYMADRNISRSLNTRLHQLAERGLAIADIPSFRELISESVSVSVLDGLPIRQWLAVEGLLGEGEVGNSPIISVGVSPGYADYLYLGAYTTDGQINLDTSRTTGTVYDAISRTKLAEMAASETAGMVQLRGDLPQPPPVVRVDLHAEGSNFVDESSILLPLLCLEPCQSQAIIMITPDGWLQPINGTVTVAGNNYQMTNGVASFGTNGIATITLPTGASIENLTPNHVVIVVGLDLQALKIMHDTTQITTVCVDSVLCGTTTTASTTTTSSVTTTESQSTTTIVGLCQISGHVNGRDVFGNVMPITGATVTASSSTFTQSTTTGEQGYYEMLLPEAAYTVAFAALGYGTQTIEIVAHASFQANYEIVLDQEPQTTTTVITETIAGSASSQSTTTTGPVIPVTTGAATEQTSQPSPQSARCIIATAAWGSEMAPDVVYMRYVRDKLIGSTGSGRTLVETFNAFYYSWSPAVAEAIGRIWLLQVVFRVLLLPLVGIVRVTALVFIDVTSISGRPDVGSVVAFLVAANMAVVVYVALPVLGTAEMLRAIRRHRA